ncbi:major capsid protein [Streptomyces sp. NPDC092046]|uniref:major capsid protein n=1 Tax=Streptomyces sp. NPDC092046 TaxID=3366009 RepID=UPI0037F819E8
MTLSLAESAKLTLDQLQRGVNETFVQESPILDRLPLVQVEGSAFKYNEESSLPGLAFRAINEAYPESTGTLNQRVETLAILGGDADVDKFIVQTRGNLTISVRFRPT